MRRLMLVASHKSANLAENVKICFNKLCIKNVCTQIAQKFSIGYKITRNTNHLLVIVCLKIKGKNIIEQKYVPTKANPADLGNRVCEICKFDSK